MEQAYLRLTGRTHVLPTENYKCVRIPIVCIYGLTTVSGISPEAYLNPMIRHDKYVIQCSVRGSGLISYLESLLTYDS